ncbi:glycosyl hydrolase family 18 protein [Bacillus sp. FJAT-45037]|uniref:glycosyl hydrolase family 18 protein n=1 Tax=Bacillus sp. FJAT-45037 TaxID=2011007 RepID=UPI000C24BD89|nr:glycosyl hydrolase family 18 protein [Bacillus sp. FJAT-45037]
MQIHVVSDGDSIWDIAQMYDVPYQLIIDVNELPNGERLVIGQALVIPTSGRFHWLEPNENIWEVSRLYEVSPESIVSMNHIHSTEDLYVWRRLYIPTEYRDKPSIDVSAYVDLNITGEESAQIVGEVANKLTFVTIFSYEMNRDGTLRPIEDQEIINAAYQQDAIPLMVITNIEDGAFSTELATEVLQSEELQDRLLDESIAIMEERGYLGLDFDLEYLGMKNREAYNELMRKAKVRLDEKGFYLSSALAPQVEAGMEGVLYEGHDYATHGELADFVFLMTYEWGWTGGPPRAVAPIDQVRRVVDYATSLMPNDKIMLGIPLYGYDWTLPFVEGESRARAIDHQQAIQLALQYNAAIEYDETAQAPYFSYIDEQGRQHEVWFDDARSIQAKFDLVKEYNLRGLFYWVLGWDFPQNWLLLEDNFTINKRV